MVIKYYPEGIDKGIHVTHVLNGMISGLCLYNCSEKDQIWSYLLLTWSIYMKYCI